MVHIAARVSSLQTTIMAEDLTKNLQSLSLSPATPFLAVNKKPFRIVAAVDEFVAYSPFKASFRLLFNYKDMNTLQLKAGSLLRIRLGNTVVPNIFECWPSVGVPQSGKLFCTFFIANFLLFQVWEWQLKMSMDGLLILLLLIMTSVI
jgi:hypothetical protein